MALCLTVAELKKLAPCDASYRRVRALMLKAAGNGHCFTAADAKAAGCTFDDVVWAASAVARNDAEVERRVRHWLADCAVRVLYIYERDYPTDMRVRDCIKAARAFADGKISAAARDAAWDAAWAAARDAAWDAAWAAAWAAARAAAWDAARAAARAAAWAAEETFQFDRIVLWLSDTPPTPLRMPKLQTVTKKAA